MECTNDSVCMCAPAPTPAPAPAPTPAPAPAPTPGPSPAKETADAPAKKTAAASSPEASESECGAGCVIAVSGLSVAAFVFVGLFIWQKNKQDKNALVVRDGGYKRVNSLRFSSNIAF